jgi:hypothetical protein
MIRKSQRGMILTWFLITCRDETRYLPSRILVKSLLHLQSQSLLELTPDTAGLHDTVNIVCSKLFNVFFRGYV